MRMKVEADILGTMCNVVCEKNASKWSAFGTYQGEPVTTRGSRTWRLALEDWRHRAESVAAGLEPKDSPPNPGFFGGFTIA